MGLGFRSSGGSKMSDFNDKSIKAYNKKADNYDNTSDGKFTEKFKELLLSYISVNVNDSILDVACGNGTLLSRMSRLKEIKGFGIDISGQMIKNATARFPEFEFAIAGCEKIPFSDSSMDIITVCAAYHHFPNVTAFASEAKRILKTDGNLYIAEIYLPWILRIMVNPFVPLSKEGDVKFYSYKEIKKTFADVGFRFVKIIKKGHIQIIHLQR